MGSIVGSFFGSTTNSSADETVAFSAISASAASAMAYLQATLESTTPEVRRLFSEYCTQSVMGQEQLNALALKKGWINPYDVPVRQLSSSLQESQSVLNS